MGKSNTRSLLNYMYTCTSLHSDACFIVIAKAQKHPLVLRLAGNDLVATGLEVSKVSWTGFKLIWCVV